MRRSTLNALVKSKFAPAQSHNLQVNLTGKSHEESKEDNLKFDSELLLVDEENPTLEENSED